MYKVSTLLMLAIFVAACTAPAPVVVTDVEVVDAGCTVNAAIQPADDRSLDVVQVRASEGGRLVSLTFAGGILILDPSDSANNEPALVKRGELWCAVGPFDGHECLSVVWLAETCWAANGQPYQGEVEGDD